MCKPGHFLGCLVQVAMPPGSLQSLLKRPFLGTWAWVPLEGPAFSQVKLRLL